MGIMNPSGKAGGLAGLRVVSFESRRSQDMAILLRQHGGVVSHAPSMREIPLADERGILEFGTKLFEGVCDALILLTGVGTTILIDALCTRWPRPAVLDRLGQTPLFCRGPKAASVLERMGVRSAVVAKAPHTEKELLRALDDRFDVRGKQVFVQEYGPVDSDFLRGLSARGARVIPVKVYRWALPEDTRDLRSALQSIAQNRVDAAIFTSAQQVDNVLEYARRLGLVESLREAFRRVVLVASIGPVTTEALRRHDIAADLVPDQAKMGALVASLARNASQALRVKRGARP
jgi:uroporphyrinogen-III synthase